jgi:hypothetical protein
MVTATTGTIITSTTITITTKRDLQREYRPRNDESPAFAGLS